MWFVVRRLSTGEIIATSANQIVPLKFLVGYENVVLYSPHPWRVEGGSGFETTTTLATM